MALTKLPLPATLAVLLLLTFAALPTLSLGAVHGFRIQYLSINSNDIDGVSISMVYFDGDGGPVQKSAGSYPSYFNDWTIFGEPETGKYCGHRDGPLSPLNDQHLMWDLTPTTVCNRWLWPSTVEDYTHGFYRAEPVTYANYIQVTYDGYPTHYADFDIYSVDELGRDIEKCEITGDWGGTDTRKKEFNCDLTASYVTPGYDAYGCADGSHGIDCSCTADATTGDAALVTTLTFDHATDDLTVTLAGALDQTRRLVKYVYVGNSAGDLCYLVPHSSWSCDATSCDCTAAVPIATFISECSPTEGDLATDRRGFTVYATVSGEDTRDTDNFGQPIDPVEVTTVAATSSTTVTTSQTVVQAVGVDQGLTSLTVDTITIIPRSANSGDTDAELEVVLTMVTPADYNIIGSVTLGHASTATDGAGVDGDATAPAWSTTCGDTCSHTITFLLATGDLTADPAAPCDFSGTTTLTSTMDAGADCQSACSDPFDITVDLVELHGAEVCNPNDDNPAVASAVEAPTDVTNPDTIVTTPGSTHVASWESTVELDGVDQASTLTSIVAALLPTSGTCTTDLVSDTAAFEVYDTAQSNYADISSIFAVEVSGLGELITLTLDSTDATAQTLYGIATSQADFRSSFAGIFCFVVTRDITLVDLSGRRLSMSVARAVAATADASARSSASMPVKVTGVDASVLGDEDEESGNAQEAASAGPIAPSSAGVITIAAIVGVALAAVAIAIAIVVVKATQHHRQSKAAAMTRVVSVASCDEVIPVDETATTRPAEPTTQSAWKAEA